MKKADNKAWNEDQRINDPSVSDHFINGKGETYLTNADFKSLPSFAAPWKIVPILQKGSIILSLVFLFRSNGNGFILMLLIYCILKGAYETNLKFDDSKKGDWSSWVSKIRKVVKHQIAVIDIAIASPGKIVYDRRSEGTFRFQKRIHEHKRRYFRSNLPVMKIQGPVEIVLSPAGVFFQNDTGFCVVDSSDLSISCSNAVQWVPARIVPAGTKVYRTQYEHTTKKGTPDKRYRENRAVAHLLTVSRVTITDGTHVRITFSFVSEKVRDSVYKQLCDYIELTEKAVKYTVSHPFQLQKGKLRKLNSSRVRSSERRHFAPEQKDDSNPAEELSDNTAVPDTQAFASKVKAADSVQKTPEENQNSKLHAQEVTHEKQLERNAEAADDFPAESSAMLQTENPEKNTSQNNLREIQATGGRDGDQGKESPAKKEDSADDSDSSISSFLQNLEGIAKEKDKEN